MIKHNTRLLVISKLKSPEKSLPQECPLRDSDQSGLIEPNGAMLMFCAFIYGFFDGTLNTQLIAMIGIIFPSERDSAGAFVVWNLGQVLAISKS